MKHTTVTLTVTCICATLMGCALSPAEDGSPEPQAQEELSPGSDPAPQAALRVAKFSEAKPALGRQVDAIAEANFSALVKDASLEVVSAGPKFDPARVGALEAFRARLGVKK